MPRDRDWYKDVLHRKGAKEACEVCGQADWIGGDATVFLPGFDEAGKLRVGHGMEVLPFACANCGNIRTHLIGVLESE